ncbi:MAG: PRC-barrel domain-containing protein [Nanoarchaeota archaeon]
MLRIKKVSEVIGKQVYTSEGDYFGQIEDVNLTENKIDGWKIRVSSGFLASFGGARGVIIPHQFVKAMGDVVVINRGSLPSRDDSMMPSPASQQMNSQNLEEF